MLFVRAAAQQFPFQSTLWCVCVCVCWLSRFSLSTYVLLRSSGVDFHVQKWIVQNYLKRKVGPLTVVSNFFFFFWQLTDTKEKKFLREKS
jgi:hypothetical protein